MEGNLLQDVMSSPLFRVYINAGALRQKAKDYHDDMFAGRIVNVIYFFRCSY